MSSWRQARGEGTVATVSICFSAFAHAHDRRSVGTGFPEDSLKSATQRMKALESLDDFQAMQGASGGLNASVYAKPEGASLGCSGFDKLTPEELAEDKAAGQHIRLTAGENATTSMMRKWLF